jgi:hypothetical protein
MAKRKATTKNEGMAMPTYKAPSAKQDIKAAAEYMASTAMRHHPGMKKMHDEISKSVQAAAGKHLGSGRMKTPSE